MPKRVLLILAVAIGLIIVLLLPKRIFRSLNPFRQTNYPASQSGNQQEPGRSPTVPVSGIVLGVYEPASSPFTHGEAIDKYTLEVGKKPNFAWFSVKWQNGQTGTYQQFDSRLLDQFQTRGITPGINWDACKGSCLAKDQTDFSWKTINSGKHDAYLTQVAKAAAAYRQPFFLRLFSEMDGPWYPWGYNAEGQGNTNPAEYIAAWKRVVDIFRREGATNVRFVWCLSAGILTQDRVNQYGELIKQLYPGDSYVDWVALDGYSNMSSGSNRSLADVFQPSYNLLKSISKRPIAFYEVGAAENPNNPSAKADWITQGFLTDIPQQFPDVKLVNWFNGPSDTNPEKPEKVIQNWAIDSSQNSLEAWKKVVNSPLYQGSLK